VPKPITIEVEVEEIAVGRVMRILHNTPGVLDVHWDMGGPKHINGGEYKEHATKGKPHQSYSVKGTDLVAQILYKSGEPMGSGELSQAFEKAGRSPHSIASPLHSLRLQGLVEYSTTGKTTGYVLTKRMKDRMRHRKGA
jgi:hypothetical protein